MAVGDPVLPLDPRISLETLVSAWPDRPLPKLARFDVLAGQGSPDEIRRAVEWIEPQQVCDVILKHHGAQGLQRVLKGIAKAATTKRIPMLPRVRGVAEFYGWRVF